MLGGRAMLGGGAIQAGAAVAIQRTAIQRTDEANSRSRRRPNGTEDGTEEGVT